MRLLFTTTLAAAIASAPALAQSPRQIGYVNLERVMVDSAPGKRSKADLDREGAQYSRELDQIVERGKALEEDLKKNAVVMSEEDRRTRERELQTLQQQFERKKAQFSEDYEAHRKEAIEGMQRRVMATVAKLAEERHVDVVVNQAVWISDAIDLTPEVLRALDATGG